MALDKDIADEAKKYGNPSSLHFSRNHANLFRRVASSGCVGTVAVVKQGTLTIAHIGDTRALVGVKNSKTGKYKAERVTPDHSLHNPLEVERIQEEHPNENVIVRDRVLGVLQPTRAIGDHRLKQTKEWLEEVYEEDLEIKNPV